MPTFLPNLQKSGMFSHSSISQRTAILFTCLSLAVFSLWKVIFSSSFNIMRISHMRATMALPSFPMAHTSVACTAMEPFQILCTCIIGSSDYLLDNLLYNMITLADKCDWALISYDNTASTKLSTVVSKARAKGVNIVMAIDGDRKPGIPKVLHWPLFQPLLGKYELIWLLDEDMSFHSFDFDSFSAALGLSFNTGVPIISQPVLWRLGLDGFTPFDEEFDEKHRNKKIKDPWYWLRLGKPVAAAQVGFIEIQVPIIDTGFFNYFLDEIFLPDVAAETGSNWGPGMYWCDIAKNYSLTHLNGIYKRPACAVIPITPLLHLNFKTLVKEDTIWRKNGRKALNAYDQKYATYRWSYIKEKRIEAKPYSTPDFVRDVCLKLHWINSQKVL